jgi:ATP-dependent Clp protease adaptor protein ClpS
MSAATLRKPGYVRLATLGGVPVFAHWTLPIGGLLLAAWVDFRLETAAAFSLTYFTLIAVHELGHGVAALLVGALVQAVHIHGAGGACHVDNMRTVDGALGIFAGGLVAQAVLLAATIGTVALFGPPTSLLARCAFQTFTFLNLFMMFVNVLPGKIGRDGLTTDGYMLWRLLTYRLGYGTLPFALVGESRLLPDDIAVSSVKALVPRGFTVGIEVRNDDRTPMDVVVEVLTQFGKLERDDAIRRMFAIHNDGGTLIGFPTLDEAEAAAAAIVAYARERCHPLRCRAVDARPPERVRANLGR